LAIISVARASIYNAAPRPRIGETLFAVSEIKEDGVKYVGGGVSAKIEFRNLG
jgi:hypothetical protein